MVYMSVLCVIKYQHVSARNHSTSIKQVYVAVTSCSVYFNSWTTRRPIRLY